MKLVLVIWMSYKCFKLWKKNCLDKWEKNFVFIGHKNVHWKRKFSCALRDYEWNGIRSLESQIGDHQLQKLWLCSRHANEIQALWRHFLSLSRIRFFANILSNSEREKTRTWLFVTSFFAPSLMPSAAMLYSHSHHKGASLPPHREHPTPTFLTEEI